MDLSRVPTLPALDLAKPTGRSLSAAEAMDGRERPLGERALPLTPAFSLQDKAPDKAQIDKAAREFESVFAKMLISSMRQASFGDSLFPNENTAYRDLYDQQLSKHLSAGKGLGLAPVIARQLSGPSATGRSPSAAEAMDGRERPSGDANTLVEGQPKPMALGDDSRISAATQATVPAGTGTVGTYHHPASARTPAWLSSKSNDTLNNGHFKLRAVGGADEVATTPQLPDDHFTLAQPIPTGPAGTDASPAKPGSPEAFVASIWPQAQRAAAKLGVDPKMLVAQAALETGWGRHVVGRQSDGSGGNLFGIKAGGSWSGQAVDARTREFVGGASVTRSERFRAYTSIDASFDDYVGLLTSQPRYAGALGTGADRRGFANALSRAGYATDPHYANKLVAIAEGPTLRRALERLNPEPVAAANTGTPTSGTALASMLATAAEM